MQKFSHSSLFLILLAAASQVGCESLQTKEFVLGESYQPANVMRKSERMPAELRRVAVLPLAISHKKNNLDHGVETLEPVLLGELKKAGNFEVTCISRQQCQNWSGQAAWMTDEKLPGTFFERLQAETGCDGFLFCELREYRPYPPLGVGWRMRLVDKTGKETLWAADEVFDAGNGKVVNAARRYQMEHEELQPGLQDSRSIMNSPRRFGQYTVAALLATLPKR